MLNSSCEVQSLLAPEKIGMVHFHEKFKKANESSFESIGVHLTADKKNFQEPELQRLRRRQARSVPL